MNDLTEMKKLVIEELARQFNSEEKRELAKEFGLADEQLDELVKKLLNKWLYSADFVMMLASVLNISIPRKTKEKKAHYIG